MLLERIEISVVMEEPQPVRDAAGCDEAIDRLANRDAALTQRHEIACGSDGDRLPGDLKGPECRKGSEHPFQVAPAAGALENLRQYQVADQNPPTVYDGPE